MKKNGKGSISSAMTSPVRGKPSLTEAPGCYTYHPNVGPRGVDGGLPLKFIDESIPVGKPEGPMLNVTGAAKK